MNKAQLVERIARETRLTRVDIETVLNKAIEVIKNNIKNGEDVTLLGFGTFTKSKRKARIGRNPQTGKEMQIAASLVPKFRPGKDFKKFLAEQN